MSRTVIILRGISFLGEGSEQMSLCSLSMGVFKTARHIVFGNLQTIPQRQFSIFFGEVRWEIEAYEGLASSD